MGDVYMLEWNKCVRGIESTLYKLYPYSHVEIRQDLNRNLTDIRFRLFYKGAAFTTSYELVDDMFRHPQQKDAESLQEHVVRTIQKEVTDFIISREVN